MTLRLKSKRGFATWLLNGTFGRRFCIDLAVDEVESERTIDGEKIKKREVFQEPSLLGQDKETQQFHLDEGKKLESFWSYRES